MKRLTILITLLAALALFGCSQEESKPAPAQSATPAPMPAEKPQVVQQAEQVVQQAKEKVEQVTEQVQEKVAQVEQQAQAVVQTAQDTMSSVSGQMVYTKSCVACHKLGIAGAPKTGDQAAWAPLLTRGVDQLTNNAINGVGKMRPKGGNAKLTDEEVRAAVEYMVEQSK